MERKREKRDRERRRGKSGSFVGIRSTRHGRLIKGLFQSLTESSRGGEMIKTQTSLAPSLLAAYNPPPLRSAFLSPSAVPCPLSSAPISLSLFVPRPSPGSDRLLSSPRRRPTLRTVGNIN